MRTRFDEQLEQLNVELIRMGALCEEAISMAAKSLLDSESGRICPMALDLDDQIDQQGAGDRSALHEAFCCSSSRWPVTCGRYPRH